MIRQIEGPSRTGRNGAGVNETAGSIMRALAIALENWCDVLERQHREELKRRALALKPRWRKADIGRLLRLDIGGERADRLHMATLFEGRGPHGGPAVVPKPKTLAEEIVAWVRFGQKLFAPATPPHFRRAMYQETRWWPHLVEAAYRGELHRARASLGRLRLKDRHGATASEIAEKRVAEAAIISAAKVHALCQRVRIERELGAPQYPEMTAAELKRHLEEGPAVSSS